MQKILIGSAAIALLRAHNQLTRGSVHRQSLPYKPCMQQFCMPPPQLQLTRGHSGAKCIHYGSTQSALWKLQLANRNSTKNSSVMQTFGFRAWSASTVAAAQYKPRKRCSLPSRILVTRNNMLTRTYALACVAYAGPCFNPFVGTFSHHVLGSRKPKVNHQRAFWLLLFFFFFWGGGSRELTWIGPRTRHNVSVPLMVFPKVSSGK